MNDCAPWVMRGEITEQSKVGTGLIVAEKEFLLFLFLCLWSERIGIKSGKRE
jgi:hypothetical protein